MPALSLPGHGEKTSCLSLCFLTLEFSTHGWHSRSLFTKSLILPILAQEKRLNPILIFTVLVSQQWLTLPWVIDTDNDFLLYGRICLLTGLYPCSSQQLIIRRCSFIYLTNIYWVFTMCSKKPKSLPSWSLYFKKIIPIFI